MKKTIVILTIAVFSIWQGLAQDVQARLNEAQSAYNAGNFENARFALQEALNGINQAIGKEILGLLPASLGSMNKVDGSDNVTGASLGFAGLYVNRAYAGGTDKTASIEIVSDSPLMAGINTILTLPAFMNSDPNQKRINVKGYKALMNKSTDDAGIVSYDIQMPFGNSLLTFKCTGITDENAVTGMINSLPIENFVKAAK